MNLLTINGQTLDLYEKELINLNYQINNISDLSTRNSTFSNTITIPNTSNNSLMFENLGMIGNISTAPYKKVKCQYIQNDIPLISNGYLQVTDVTPDTIKIVMYSGIIDLIENLGEKDIKDLTLTQYNHFTDKDTYINSFQNTSGYIYGVADYGAAINSVNIRIDYQPPSLFMHTLWDEILVQGGYTYSGDIFTTTDFKNMVVTPSDGYDIPEPTPETIINLAAYSTDEIISDYTGGQDVTHIFPLVFNEIPPITGFVLTNPNTITSTIDTLVRYRFNTEIVVDYGEVEIIFERNGVLIINEFFDDNTPGIGLDYGFPIETNIGDTLTGYLRVKSKPYDNIIEGVKKYGFTFNTEFDMAEIIGGGRFIELDKIFSGTTQVSFIKDIMQHFGMVVTTNNNNNNNDNNNHLEFITLQNLLDTNNNYEDWTDYFIKNTNEDFVLKGYGKNNSMKYKYEKDITQFDYDGTIIINNEHLIDEKILLTSIFKIREKGAVRLGNQMFKIPLWKEEFKDGEWVRTKQHTELSLFTLNRQNLTIKLKAFENDVQTSHTANVPFLSQNKISYQFFINKYYPRFKALLDRNKILSVVMNLNEIQLKNLDFFTLKYLKQTGKYYYLNVLKTNSNGLTTVELAEIN